VTRKILIVDDSPSMRALLCGLLRSLGYETAEAANGQLALDQIGSTARTFDLIMSDLNMPVMDGITLIKNLRNVPALKYTPMLLLTTETSTELSDKARAAGATGWVTKPFNLKSLEAALHKVLG